MHAEGSESEEEEEEEVDDSDVDTPWTVVNWPTLRIARTNIRNLGIVPLILQP